MNFKIYTSKTTPRLEYGVYIIFGVVLNQDYIIIESTSKTKERCILICDENDNKLAQLGLNELLFETSIEKKKLVVDQMDGLPFFFKTDDAFSLPFDLFSLAFYLTSRYEEYVEKKNDFLGRYEGINSLAYKNDFLKIPLIDLWTYRLKETLELKLGKEIAVDNTYHYIPSIDIDIAWAFKNKTWLVALGKAIKSTLTLKFDFLKYQMKTLLNKTEDPYDTYDLIDKLEVCYDLNHKYFISVGDRGRLDAAINYKNGNYIDLIRKLNKNTKAGIHPSIRSNKNKDILKQEIRRLKTIVNSEIKTSRQHYLVLNFPDTYQNLIEEGINEDYTLGYHDTVGFRASIAQPFKWFDLTTNQQTNLEIHPFQIMDVVLKDRMGVSHDETMHVVKRMVEVTRSVNGEFVSIAHNSSFSALDNWTFFENMYKKVLNMCKV